MKLRFSTLVIVQGLALASSAVSAHEPHECPPDVHDVPGLTGHVNQQDILSGKMPLRDVVLAGRNLLIVDFNRCDGRGRPGATGNLIPEARDIPGQELIRFFTRTSGPEAMGCAGCHNQPQANGSGDFPANVQQGVPTGTVPAVREFLNLDFAPAFPHRNTPTIFGAGAVELVGREMTEDLLTLKNQAAERSQQTGQDVTVELVTKGVSFGKLTVRPNKELDFSQVEGVDPDLIVKPFQHKGGLRSMREFAATAGNQHHGMQAVERFGHGDFDNDGIDDELTIGDITAMALGQVTLPVPRRTPTRVEDQTAVTRGEQLFTQLQCTGCHIPALTLKSTQFCEPYIHNPPGTLADQSQKVCFDLANLVGLQGNKVEMFSDLKRHVICDDKKSHYCSDPISPLQFTDSGYFVQREQFMTTKLWDMGNSAPYGHRGDLSTLHEAIVAHGGEATNSAQLFEALSPAEQQAVVIFLKTLKGPLIPSNPNPQEMGSPQFTPPSGSIVDIPTPPLNR